MELKCLKCGCRATHKNGHMKGHQRYKCKNCGCQYTKTTQRGKPEMDKILKYIIEEIIFALKLKKSIF